MCYARSDLISQLMLTARLQYTLHNAKTFILVKCSQLQLVALHTLVHGMNATHFNIQLPSHSWLSYIHANTVLLNLNITKCVKSATCFIIFKFYLLKFDLLCNLVQSAMDFSYTEGPAKFHVMLRILVV